MTNRKEVAKRWREIGERLDKIPPTSLTGTACVTLFELLGSAEIRDNNSYSDVFNRLADLIDPTCEVVEVPDNDEFMVRVVSGFMCKKCGHESIVERNCDGWAEPPNYCPHCGSRVVRDEA